MRLDGTLDLLPRFLSVGALGFLLDVTVFQILMSAGHGPVAARTVSALLAITLTWYLNRLFVFKTGTASRKGPEYVRYLLVQTIGLAVNFGLFVVLVTFVPPFQRLPLAALFAGASAAIAFNFLGARYWAFRKKDRRR